jgi:predicted  nucleic acid-binding Zn-ribbon protein
LLLAVIGVVWLGAYRVFPAFGFGPPKQVQELLVGLALVTLVFLWLFCRALRKPIVLADVCWAKAISVGFVLTILIFWGLLALRAHLGLKPRALEHPAGTVSPVVDPGKASTTVPKDEHTRAAYLLAVLLDNKWFQPAIVWLFLIAATACVLKSTRLRREQRAHRYKVASLLDWPERQFTVDETGDLLKKISENPKIGSIRQTALVRRVERMLERVENTKSSAGVDELMNSLAGIDADASASSFGGVTFLIYLMPAIGFLGTIYGVGQAVYGFSLVIPKASNFAEISGDLTNITYSLGTAFDTTLLGLVLSALASLGMTIIRQREEALLGQVDNDCVEMFRSLTHEDPGTQQIVDAISSLGDVKLREKLDEHVKNLRDRVKDLAKALEQAGKEFEPLTRRMDEGAKKLETSSNGLADTVKEIAKSAKDLNKTMADETRHLVESLSSDVNKMGETIKVEWEKMAATLSDRVGQVAKRLDDSLESASTQGKSYSSAAQALTAKLESTSEKLVGLSGQVKELGGHLEGISHLDDIGQTLKHIQISGVRFVSDAPTAGTDGHLELKPSDKTSWWQRHLHR